MIGKCAKQEVVAVIKTKNNKIYTGSNSCENAQEVCPRIDSKTGEDYKLCKSVCKQKYHAEVSAIKQCKTRKELRGGTIYLIGHTYVCDKCKKELDKVGITNVMVL